MRFLYNEHSEMWLNIDSLYYKYERENKLPKQYSKMKDWLTTVAISVFGEDNIVTESKIRNNPVVIGHTIVVCYELEKPFVGINQSRQGEERISEYYAQMAFRYIKDTKTHDLAIWTNYKDDFNIWDGVMEEDYV